MRHMPSPSHSSRSALILSTHLCLCLPSGLVPSGFPTKTLYTPLSSPIRATCPAHLILLHFITCTILSEEYKSFSSSLCNLLHSPVTLSLLGPYILLNTMFSNTLSFLSVSLKSDKNKINTLHEDQYMFMIISYLILLRVRNLSDKICRENQDTHFLFNTLFFFFW